MSAIHCPVCNRFFEAEKSQSLPFCSDRCRLIDLSRWLDEKYMLPVEEQEQQGAEKPESDEPPQDDS